MTKMKNYTAPLYYIINEHPEQLAKKGKIQ